MCYNFLLGKHIKGNLYNHEDSTEWEQLYDRWQEGACETAFSLGTEIYSVGVARRCGQDSGAIAITYQFSLDADEKEEAVRLLGEKERRFRGTGTVYES